MGVDVQAWLIAAIALLVGGVLSLLTRRDRLWLPLTALAAGLIGIVAGLGWRGWAIDTWPGTYPAEALAMLAGGALIVAAWAAPRWAEPQEEASGGRSVALGCVLLGAAMLVFAAAALAWRGAPTVAAVSASTWTSSLRAVLTGIGLGGWLPVCAGSVWGLWLASRRGEFPAAATDRGRPAAIFSYPWLTVALLVGVAGNLAARATVLALQPGDLWPLVAWLLGAIYLHATSTWRPRRVAAWLATALAALALAAAVMSAVSAP